LAPMDAAAPHVAVVEPSVDGGHGSGHLLRVAATGGEVPFEGVGLNGKFERSPSALTSDSRKEEEKARAMFLDTCALKDKVRKAAMMEPYDVSKFYWEFGVFPQIARHPRFEQLTLAVIALNALWISIDTDHNTAEMLLQAQPVFQIAEHFFCVYFAFEWFVRWKSFKRKRNGLRDAWFVFDSSLVFMIVAETWVMTIVLIAIGSGGSGGLGNASILRMARLLRLSRMARMARLFRAMPELLILIKGMAAAVRSVFFTMLLLFIIVYVFGIAFRQMVGDTVVNPAGDKCFGTVYESMHTLLLSGTIMDGTFDIVQALEEKGILYAVMFYIFILLASLTVMNMLIGVLCEVVSTVATTERETMAVNYVKEQLQRVMRGGGNQKDGDWHITKEEFSQLLDVREACAALEEVGVDVCSLIDNIDFIFPEEADDGGQITQKELNFRDFLELILKLRGSNFATVKDMVDLRKFVKASFARLKLDLRGGRRGAGLSKSSLPARAASEGGLPSLSPVCAPPPDVDQVPDSCLPQEKELLHRRAKLMDALLSVQVELARFQEVIPIGDSFELPPSSLMPSHPPEASVCGSAFAETAPWRVTLTADSPLAFARKAPSKVTLTPIRVHGLPGQQFCALQGQFDHLQRSLVVGLGGLQRCATVL